MALAAMLGHGSLAWQHFILPIVPPNMLTYVSAPMPYLIGMLQAHTRMLGNIQDIGEFLLVNVDKTGADALMVYNSSDEVNYAPDILTQTIRFDQPSNQLNFAGVELKNTFEDILKCDYRVWATTGIQGAVTKASDLGKKVYEGFKIIRKKSKGSKNSREQVERNASYEDFGDEDDQGNNVSVYVDFENEKCEVRIRLALVAFFLDLYGNPRFYLSRNDSNQLVVDKRKFIVEKEKRMSGVDPLLCLLEPFSESQHFEQFAKRMVAHITSKIVLSSRKPIFLQCVDQLFTEKSGFSPQDIQQTIMNIYPKSARNRLASRERVREIIMELTSTTKFRGNIRETMEMVIRECSSINVGLTDVLNVIWMRIKDCRGTRWRHGQTSMQLLKSLLIEGPVVVLASCIENYDQICAMRNYSSTMGNTRLVRIAANELHELVVSYSKLFLVRRRYAAANKLMSRRPEIKKEAMFQQYIRDIFAAKERTKKVSFHALHTQFAPATYKTMKRNPSIVSAPTADLLSFSTENNVEAASDQNILGNSSQHYNGTQPQIPHPQTAHPLTSAENAHFNPAPFYSSEKDDNLQDPKHVTRESSTGHMQSVGAAAYVNYTIPHQQGGHVVPPPYQQQQKKSSPTKIFDPYGN